LPRKSHQFFQLYIYSLSVVRFARSDAIFTVYSDDEGSREAVGTGYDLEKSVRGPGLGVFSYGMIYEKN